MLVVTGGRSYEIIGGEVFDDGNGKIAVDDLSGVVEDIFASLEDGGLAFSEGRVAFWDRWFGAVRVGVGWGGGGVMGLVKWFVVVGREKGGRIEGKGNSLVFACHLEMSGRCQFKCSGCL